MARQVNEKGVPAQAQANCRRHAEPEFGLPDREGEEPDNQEEYED